MNRHLVHHTHDATDVVVAAFRLRRPGLLVLKDLEVAPLGHHSFSLASRQGAVEVGISSIHDEMLSGGMSRLAG